MATTKKTTKKTQQPRSDRFTWKKGDVTIREPNEKEKEYIKKKGYNF